MLNQNLTFIATILTCFLLFTHAYPIEQQNNLSEDTDSETTSSETSSLHRQNLFPISSAAEIWGSVLLIFIAGLCNSGGLAGRPILLCILIIVFNYTSTYAIEIVFSVVFGASLGNFLNVVGRKDPITKKPLIEYNIALVCMPTMLLGASFGIILHRMAATLIITIGIVIISTMNLIGLYRRAKYTYREENQKQDEDESTIEERTPPQIASYLVSPLEGGSEERTVDFRLGEYYQSERRLIPIKKIGMMALLIIIIMIIDLSRGTQNFESIVEAEYCGAVYWGIVCLLIVVCFVMLFLNIRMLRPSLELKKIYNLVTTQNRFELSDAHVRVLPLRALLGGLLSGFIGIGSGMSPVFLNIGVPATSIGATSGFIIMQTSFVSLFQAILYEEIPLRDQGFFFLISFVGSFGVSNFLIWMVKRFKRPSLLIFTLVVILCLFLVATPVFVIITEIDDLNPLLQFSGPC